MLTDARSSSPKDRETRTCSNSRAARDVSVMGSPVTTFSEPGAWDCGPSLTTLLAAEEAGQLRDPRAKSVLFLFLFGGPSQLETFDMKPTHPAESAGPTARSSHARRDFDVRASAQARSPSDKYAVIRTMTHRHNDHNACHYIQTGHPLPPARRGPRWSMPPRRIGRRWGRSSTTSITSAVPLPSWRAVNRSWSSLADGHGRIHPGPIRAFLFLRLLRNTPMPTCHDGRRSSEFASACPRRSEFLAKGRRLPILFPIPGSRSQRGASVPENRVPIQRYLPPRNTPEVPPPV